MAGLCANNLATPDNLGVRVGLPRTLRCLDRHGNIQNHNVGAKFRRRVQRGFKSHPIILISASSGPSSVRVNTETVYSGRCEAGVHVGTMTNSSG
jgi:hypothetical protein